MKTASCVPESRFSRKKDENRVMIHNDFAKRASTIHRGINEGSKVIFGFSICGATIGIMYTAVLLLLLKKKIIKREFYKRISHNKQTDLVTA